MLWFVMIFMTVVCSLLQAAVPTIACLGQAKVPLLLSVTVYYALNHETGEAAVAGLLCGVAHDVMSFIPVGQTAAVFLVVALLSGRFRKLVHGDEIFTASLFGGLAALVSVFAGYHLLSRIDLISVPAGALWHKALGTMLLGAGCTPLVFMVTHRLDSLVGNVLTTEVIEDVLD
jgi:rod shape-determining protein MreD